MNQEVVFSIQFLLSMANMYDVCNNSPPCRVSATLEESTPYLQAPRIVHISSTTWGHCRFLNLSSCPLCFLHMKVTFKCLALRFHLGPLTVTFFSEAMESTSERGLLEANSAKTFYLTPPNHIMKLK